MKRPLRFQPGLRPAALSRIERPGPASVSPPRTGLARALSKLGFCSRREAWELIREGRVTLNGRVCREPERPVLLAKDRLEVDAQSVAAAHRVYLMLNKPRGLVTTAADEQGRATVFACFTEADLPKISPVGRLDMASEGLLLFTNDHDWAAGLLDPNRHVAKTYDVQIDRLADDGLLELLRRGVLYGQETLKVREVRLLRAGHRHCWLQIGLEEGRNRHLRRMFEALGIVVRRLVRIRIGGLELGNLQKGAWRHLTPAEVAALRSAGCGLPVTAAGTAPPPDRRSAARAR